MEIHGVKFEFSRRRLTRTHGSAVCEKVNVAQSYSFLWQKEEHWPLQDKIAGELETSNLEQKKISVHATNVQEQESLLARLARFLDWQRLQAAFVRCLNLKQWLSQDNQGRLFSSNHCAGSRACRDSGY